MIAFGQVKSKRVRRTAGSNNFNSALITGALTQLVEIAQMGQSPSLEDRYLVAEHLDI